MKSPNNIPFNSLKSVKEGRVSWWSFVGGGVGLTAILIWMTWDDSGYFGDGFICC